MTATTPPAKSGLLARLTRSIAAHPWRTIGIWVLIIVGIFAAAGTIGGQLQNKFTIPNRWQADRRAEQGDRREGHRRSEVR